jgi:hypothetical protein
LTSLRRIVVDDRTFRWRFDGKLVVIPATASCPQLYVDWGWKDWLEPDGPGDEPSVVTPRFVADAIRFGLANGWCADMTSKPMRLTLEDGRFRLNVEKH